MYLTWVFLGGALGLVVAVVHAVLGQRLILAPVGGLSPTAERVLVAVFHLSSLYWAVAGITMMWAALAAPARSVQVLGAVVVLTYLSGAVANFWATRGRHIGWMLLTACSMLIGAGSLGLGGA